LAGWPVTIHREILHKRSASGSARQPGFHLERRPVAAYRNATPGRRFVPQETRRSSAPRRGSRGQVNAGPATGRRGQWPFYPKRRPPHNLGSPASDGWSCNRRE
jgi:hypothetical protein